ncbi:ABC transporter substrate-binding protein [Verminephrobacter eiseniae]|uniref:ABC transporter substrate-binding protein n=1 Tax=Verminephrobacter eiseniae TaxID=364317 RepID=UPI002237F622|nr:signal peptide prediction [Verminephrobacter eiseniae]MCW5233846.1 signal peptide prediction [Verminephrobacter eiseniae]MCW5294598.1 signal peptide prediction [Verminephrobacter eiseniae]MCW8184843.1 signal peptide prediction [Verminephrobacter eiseniae]MCW8223589.1 signal peptide prediction [Verminephrobacter eiseniae]MCW8234637.1 signal peptide prediction [Verminephrobacter eiseniae]
MGNLPGVRPQAPAIHAGGRPHLRVLGTEITLLDSVRERAEADLGIRLSFEPLDFLSAQQRAATDTGSYDVYDQCFHSLDIVWFWHAIQPIDLRRIALWGEVSDLTKRGRITPEALIGCGDAPVHKLYVQPDLTLGAAPSARIAMLPAVHNMDAFAVTPQVLASMGDDPGWDWLLDARLSGCIALVDEPAIGIFDAALAARSTGEFEPRDIGNLSIREIDRLIAILLERKRRGHFVGFWKTMADSVRLMQGGMVGVQSIWSPALTALAAEGVPVIEVAPREGYRAWHGGMCLSRHLKGRMLDVAYDYLNWWLCGWPGAVMARQGYYMAASRRVRDWLSPQEWDYWYEGKPAACDLRGPDGRIVVRAGTLRSGGSYWRKASRIAVWNTTMDEHNYMARRWKDFIDDAGIDGAAQ